MFFFRFLYLKKSYYYFYFYFFASRQQKNWFSLAAMVALQRRKHSQTWQGREPVSSSGPNSLRTPSWRWVHAPCRLRKDHQPLSRRRCGRHGSAWSCVSRKHVMAPMFDITIGGNCIRERSLRRNFTIYGLRAQHFSDSALLRSKKWRKYCALTVWHVLSDYGLKGNSGDFLTMSS